MVLCCVRVCACSCYLRVCLIHPTSMYILCIRHKDVCRRLIFLATSHILGVKVDKGAGGAFWFQKRSGDVPQRSCWTAEKGLHRRFVCHDSLYVSSVFLQDDFTDLCVECFEWWCMHENYQVFFRWLYLCVQEWISLFDCFWANPAF